MEKKFDIYTEEKNEQLIYVRQNDKIKTSELIMQIYLLLDDYFYGTFIKNTKSVLMKMKNGQVFRLSVTEVVCGGINSKNSRK